MYKRWFVGFNDYHKTASIFLEEVPIGLVFLEWLSFTICDFISNCNLLLPKIKFKLRNKDYWDCTNNNDGIIDLREWYGDVSSIWHMICCIYITNLINKRSKVKIIPISFDFAKKNFLKEYNDLKEEDI